MKDFNCWGCSDIEHQIYLSFFRSTHTYLMVIIKLNVNWDFENKLCCVEIWFEIFSEATSEESFLRSLRSSKPNSSLLNLALRWGWWACRWRCWRCPSRGSKLQICIPPGWSNTCACRLERICLKRLFEASSEGFLTHHHLRVVD